MRLKAVLLGLAAALVAATLLFLLRGERQHAAEVERTLRKREEALERRTRHVEAEAGRLDEKRRALESREKSKADLPYIYVITPTYKRLTQKADMTRLSHTLRLVANVHWIIVEDSNAPTDLVTAFLESCGLEYTHKFIRTPTFMQRKICQHVDPRNGCPQHRLGKEEELWKHPRGVEQRNLGLQAVRDLAPSSGVVYFADDDNSYTLRVFEEMRTTRKASIWHVGLAGDMRYEGPTVVNGVVTGWHVGWRPDRPYPVDMAAFAVHVREVTSRPKLRFIAKAQRGWLESEFLQQILKGKEEFEPKGLDCSCVLVWHTRTVTPNLKWEKKTPSDPRIII